MVFELNKSGGETFRGGAVTCYTCHRGKPAPVSVPVIADALTQKTGTAVRAAKTEAPLPTVEEILERYALALGGKAALGRLTTRYVKGSRVGADGVLVPEEIYQKAPDVLAVTTTYPQAVFHSGFDGTRAWARDNRGSDQLNHQFAEALKRESEFYNGLRLRELYPSIRSVTRATVRDRETYVVEAPPAAGVREKWFFDAQTGLLVRRYLELGTVLGPTPIQVDYDDYREVDGVMLPFSIRWSNPRYSWGRKIEQVRHNLPVEEERFKPPSNR
jgi:hypothetical protein